MEKDLERKKNPIYERRQSEEQTGQKKSIIEKYLERKKNLCKKEDEVKNRPDKKAR